MYKKRRLFTVFLSIMLIMSLMCSCGGQPGESSPQDETAGQTSGTAVSVPVDTSGGDFANILADSGLPDLSGTVSGNAYENPYFGFGCTFDDGWSLLTGDEVLLATSVLSGENGEEYYSPGSSVCVYAYSESGALSVSVTAEDMVAVYGAGLSGDDYAETVLSEALDGMSLLYGVSPDSYEFLTVNFADAPRNAVKIISHIDAGAVSADLYQLVVCVKSGDYMAEITITSFYEDLTDFLSGQFYEI